MTINRRGLFSLFAAVPVSAAAAVSLKAEPEIPQNVTRFDPTSHRCGCGSHMHHFIVDHSQHYFIYAKAVCSRCGSAWPTGRTV